MKSKWLTLTFLIIACVTANAQLTQGPNNPSSVAEDGSVGSISWSSAGGALGSDNSYATASASFVLFGSETKLMKVTGFGFNVPVSSTIDGVTVRIERKASGLNFVVHDLKVYLLREDTMVGLNYAKTGVLNNWSGADAVSIYGGANDTWGSTWTVSQINSSKFGVGFTGVVGALAGLSAKAYVDNISVTIHYSSTLPIELISQDAVALESVNEITWETATETNNKGFYIERLNDSDEWERIGFVAGVGNSNKLQSYAFQDDKIGSGLEFNYRINQVDENGVETVFDILRVQRPIDEEPMKIATLYPNPSINFFYKATTLAASDIVVRAMDGKEVYREHCVSNGAPCRLNHSLPKGMYVVEELAAGHVSSPEILYVTE